MALCTGMHSVGLATLSISTQRDTAISPDNGVHVAMDESVPEVCHTCQLDSH